VGKRGNGEGTIRHNVTRARWEARVTVGTNPDGQPIRRMVTAATRREVSARLDELRRADIEGRTLARRDLTVARFLDQWLTDVLPGSVSAATESNYATVVALYIRPHLGRKRLRTLQARDVTRMLRDLEAAGLAPNTRRLARSVLRRTLRWAEVEGFVARNVAALADGVKLATPEGRSLTPHQARTLLTYLDGHRLEAAFTVALALGLRRGELLGLAWSDIDLDATPPRLTVARSLKRLRPAPGQPSRLVLDDTKTRQSRRTVHLPGPAASALRAHRRRQVTERLAAGDLWTEHPLGADLVFRTEAGTAVDPDNFRNVCYKVTVAAGVGRWSPHALRHSAASILLAQGVPLKLVSETLGHSSIRVTADVYTHLMEPARTEVADAMTAALWGAG